MVANDTPQPASTVLDYRTAPTEANVSIVQTKEGTEITLPGLPRGTQWLFVVLYALFGTIGTVAWAMVTTAAVLFLRRPGIVVPALGFAFLALPFGLMALICWTSAFQHSPWGIRARSAGKLLLQSTSAYYLPSGTTRFFGLQAKPSSYAIEQIYFDRISRTSANLRIACAQTKWDRYIGLRIALRIVTGDPQTLQDIAVAIRSCPGIEAHFLPFHDVPLKAPEQQAL